MDNRLKLPGPKIDFNQVGTTGQDHDNYPAPGQARYDHLRMYLIALLSQQSGDQAPTQYRDGTPWLDTSGDPPQLKIALGGQFVPYAAAINLGTGITLQGWFAQAQTLLASLSPDMTFSGTATGYANSITVPGPLRGELTTNSVPLVYVNGLLLDPRACNLNNGIISLSSAMRQGDRYSVIIRGIPPQYFFVPDVPAP